MPNKNNTGKEQSELLQALSVLTDINRTYYLKLIEAGFTSSQALTLTGNLTSALLNPGAATPRVLPFAWPKGGLKQ